MSQPLEIIPPKPAPLLLSYLRLFRLPNVFTAMADVAMGYLFIERAIARLDVFLCLVGASSCLYTAGMVLNDVYDLEVDARERPERPLPSGRISAAWAKWLGYELLLVGLALGWLAGIGMFGLTAAGCRSGGVATALALCVVLYNAILKKTFLGPVAMGTCRFLNVLLGMSIAGADPAVFPQAEVWRLVGYSLPELMIAGGIGIYIAGVTWFARNEAEESSRLQLALGMVVMIGGVVLLAFFPNYLPAGSHLQLNRQDIIWPLLLVLVTLTPLRRCGSAVLNPSPQRVQIAVKLSIMTLIVLDAGVVMAVVGPYYALGVVALIVPAFLLGKWGVFNVMLGYNTNGLAHHDPLAAIALLAEMGYESVALTIDHGLLSPTDDRLSRQLGAIRSALAGYGMRSVIETGARFLLDPHAKHEPTLMSPSNEKQAIRINFLKHAIDMARELRSDCVSFWSGILRDEISESTAFERLAAGLAPVVEYAGQQGVTLAFEPEPGMFIDTMARFEQLLERLDAPHFRLTLDVGHLHCLGETPIADVICRWGPRIANIHIEDMRAGVHEHLMFGEGEMDFPPIIAALREVGYRGGLHVELSRHSHDGVNAARRAFEFLTPLVK